MNELPKKTEADMRNDVEMWAESVIDLVRSGASPEMVVSHAAQVVSAAAALNWGLVLGSNGCETS